jgi:hypothetical protein
VMDFWPFKKENPISVFDEYKGKWAVVNCDGGCFHGVIGSVKNGYLSLFDYDPETKATEESFLKVDSITRFTFDAHALVETVRESLPDLETT